MAARTEGMGDHACYREFCPDCDAQVSIVDEECPDCGRALELR
jgi:predicted amidophosphoribosyltransferase